MLVMVVAIFNKKLRFFFYQFCFFHLRLYSDDITVAIDLDGSVWADNCAQAATGTFSLGFFGGKIACFVGFCGDGNTVLIANGNTKTAAFTAFGINYNFGTHPVLILP
jgi:hypothetical protein